MSGRYVTGWTGEGKRSRVGWGGELVLFFISPPVSESKSADADLPLPSVSTLYQSRFSPTTLSSYHLIYQSNTPFMAVFFQQR